PANGTGIEALQLWRSRHVGMVRFHRLEPLRSSMNRTRIGIRTLLALIVGTFLLVSGAFFKSAAKSAAMGQAQLSDSSPTPQVKRVGQVPKAARQDNFLEYMAAGEKIRMLMTFQVRHEARLQAFLAQVYDPESSLYHQWLTPEEYGRRFGRTEGEFNQAVAWLQSQGMEVERQYSNRLAIGFTGTVDAVQRAFQVQMGQYVDPAQGRTFYSNSGPPTLPPEIDNITIGLVGLNNAQVFHRPARRSNLTPLTAQQQAGAASGGFQPQGKVGSSLVLFPKDLALLYDYQPLWTNNVKGQGQKVGVIIDSDIRDSDMNVYRTTTGLPALTVTRVVYPALTNPGLTAGEFEADLDTQSISAVAPNAEIDLVIVTDLSFTSIGLAEQDLVNQNTIKVVSESLGICESEGFLTSEQNIFNQAAAQGIAF